MTAFGFFGARGFVTFFDLVVVAVAVFFLVVTFFAAAFLRGAGFVAVFVARVTAARFARGFLAVRAEERVGIASIVSYFTDQLEYICPQRLR